MIELPFGVVTGVGQQGLLNGCCSVFITFWKPADMEPEMPL